MHVRIVCVGNNVVFEPATPFYPGMAVTCVGFTTGEYVTMLVLGFP